MSDGGKLDQYDAIPLRSASQDRELDEQGSIIAIFCFQVRAVEAERLLRLKGTTQRPADCFVKPFF
jgi:hypothetical protein